MQIIPLPRVIGFLAACLSTQLWLSAAHAHLAVQIRGSAQLDADVDSEAAASVEVAIRGRLRDELGQSIAGAKIRLEPTRGQSSVRAKDCGSRTTATTTDIETDAEGHFCARLARNELAGGSPLRVTFDGSENYGSATTTVALEDTRAGLSVDFGQLSHVVNLDANELDFVVELHPIVPAALRDSLPLSIELALRANDSGKFDERALQRQQAKVSTPIHFTVPSRQLGRPGIGELVLAFDGNPSYKPFRSLYRIERTTSVRLTVSDWPESGVQGDRISVVARAVSGTNLPPPGSSNSSASTKAQSCSSCNAMAPCRWSFRSRVIREPISFPCAINRSPRGGAQNRRCVSRCISYRKAVGVSWAGWVRRCWC